MWFGVLGILFWPGGTRGELSVLGMSCEGLKWLVTKVGAGLRTDETILFLFQEEATWTGLG